VVRRTLEYGRSEQFRSGLRSVVKSVMIIVASFVLLAVGFALIVKFWATPMAALEPNIVVHYTKGGHSKLRLEPGKEYRLAIIESSNGKALTWWKEVPDVSYTLTSEGKILRKEGGTLWDSEYEVKAAKQ
jgi:hypothetical protein